MNGEKPTPVIVKPSERFGYVTPTPGQATRLAVARSIFTHATEQIEDTCAPGRYLALALTSLEEAAMWVNKSITHEPQR